MKELDSVSTETISEVDVELKWKGQRNKIIEQENDNTFDILF